MMTFMQRLKEKGQNFCRITPEDALYDRSFILLFFFMLLIGLVVTFTASTSDPEWMALPPAKKALTSPNPLRFFIKDGLNILLAIGAFFFALSMPLNLWKERFLGLMVLICFIFLCVLVLHITPQINGAYRWIPLGFMNFQPAELTKLMIVCFLASYIARRYETIRQNRLSLVKPMLVTGLFAGLIILQPDTGSAVVLISILLGMFFLAGAKLLQVFALIVIAILFFAINIAINPYKIDRMTYFSNPFADPYGKGYQLVNSLIAFGRGEITGEGLGNSVQKWAYLSESHTDFITSIWGEEFGLIGTTFMLLLFFLLIWKILKIGQEALMEELRFGGFLAYGIACWFFCQSFINLGSALGMIPTKGLTLPFISYGGSSLLIMSMAMGIVMRVDHITRLTKQGKNLEIRENENATT